MVVTHKNTKRQKRMPIHVKPDDPARLHMSKAQAVEANRKLREDRLKLDRYAQELKEKRQKELGVAVNNGNSTTTKKVNLENKADEIAKLQEEMDNLKGPGTYMKKQAIQKKIDKLLGKEVPESEDV